MGVLFSAVTVTAGEKQAEFLVAGIPKQYDDLEGWTLFEEFMDELDEECTVQVHADAYVYGEGEEFIATPEEVAYMTIRRQDRPDFLEARCYERGESEFTIDWSPKELFKNGGNTMTEMERLHRQAQRNKAHYPPGTRLELLHMDDPYSPVPDGTRGTVKFVDDAGQLHMNWDNGRTLAVDTDVDTIRKLTMDEIAEEEIAKGHEVVNLGDDCQIVLPDEPVDCSSLGYFDELEEECWDLVKSYCSRLGIKMIPDEDGKPPISFDVAKSIQDSILGQLEEAGVEFHFDGQDEGFNMKM